MSDKKLEKMKEDYREMKIPSHLKEAVMESMEKAKREEMKKQKGIMLFKRSAQVAAAALVGITVAANSSASVASAMEKIPVLGAITKVVTFRNYEVNNENTHANIKVPQIEVIPEEGSTSISEETIQKVNKSVEEYTNQLIAQFEADIAEFAEYEGEDGGPHEAVFTDYEVVTDTDKLFSLRIDTTISKGGSANLTKIYHIDKRSDSVITLKDLFKEDADYRNIISENMKTQMRANMEADDGRIYFLDSEEGMEEWDFKSIEAEENFYFAENGNIVLVFDEYKVAPGYMGIVEMEIPMDEIAHLVKEEYLP